MSLRIYIHIHVCIIIYRDKNSKHTGGKNEIGLEIKEMRGN